MAYYLLDVKKRNTLAGFLEIAKIKGSDAKKLITIAAIIQNKVDFPYAEINDELAKFILGMLDTVEIQGKYAMLLVELQLAFSKPLPNKPDLKDSNINDEKQKAKDA